MGFVERYEERMGQLDADLRDLHARAIEKVDEYWSEAIAYCKGSDLFLSRGVRTRTMANGTFMILWFKYSYTTANGKKKREVQTLNKGGETVFRYPRRVLGKMEVWQEEFFLRYEDHFEQIRKLIKMTRDERVRLRAKLKVARALDHL